MRLEVLPCRKVLAEEAGDLDFDLSLHIGFPTGRECWWWLEEKGRGVADDAPPEYPYASYGDSLLLVKRYSSLSTEISMVFGCMLNLRRLDESCWRPAR